MIEKVKPSSKNMADLSSKSDKQEQGHKPLSFSINRILGDTNDKKSRDQSQDEVPRVPRMHFSTVHHYGHDIETSSYQHFGK